MTAARAKRVERRRIQWRRFDWRGITIAVAYEADWLGSGKLGSDLARAHLQIEAVKPERARLPITETGYLSHFIGRHVIESAGGPSAYMTAWLDEAAKDRRWIEAEDQARQLSLF